VDVVDFLRHQETAVNLVCYHRAAAACLDALLLYPSLQKKVYSLISFEGKIWGLEEAHRTLHPLIHQEVVIRSALWDRPLGMLLGLVKEWVFPSSQGLYAMHPSLRRRYRGQIAGALKQLGQRMTLQSIDSSESQYGTLPHSSRLEVSQSEKKGDLSFRTR
jgi:hypothetical protein